MSLNKSIALSCLLFAGCLQPRSSSPRRYEQPENVSTAKTPDPSEGKADAKKYFQEGQQLFQQKRYLASISWFEAAERSWPSPINDYNIALSFFELGDAVQAEAYWMRHKERSEAQGVRYYELPSKKSSDSDATSTNAPPPAKAPTRDTAPSSSSIPAATTNGLPAGCKEISENHWSCPPEPTNNAVTPKAPTQALPNVVGERDLTLEPE